MSRKRVVKRRMIGKGLFNMLGSLLGGRRIRATRPRVRRVRRVQRGRGFGDFIGNALGGLGTGLGSGVHNLLGSLFGGRRTLKYAAKMPALIRPKRAIRVTRRKAPAKMLMLGRGPEMASTMPVNQSGFSLSNLNKALKDSKAISNLLNNSALGGIANTAGTVADALGYGRRKRQRGRGVNYLQTPGLDNRTYSMGRSVGIM